MDITATIRKFVQENFLFSSGGKDFDDQVSFMGSGLVDSTGVLEIIQFIEETFGIAVADEELIPENLDSVENLAHFVGRKLGQVEQQRCAL
jgi:acyl carrier protein